MKLVIEDEAGTRTVVPLTSGDVVVGRSAEGGVFRLPDRDVSRRHARFLVVSGVAFVEDLGSLTGTQVNGERIAGRRRLRDGDLVEIAAYDLAVVPDEGLAEVAGPGAPPPLPAPGPAAPAPPPAPASRDAPPEPSRPAPAAATASAPAAHAGAAGRRQARFLVACGVALLVGVLAGLAYGLAAMVR
jgi:hypothetical protein